MSRKIAILAGDGIGPEIMKEALRVLELLNHKRKLEISYLEGFIGGEAYSRFKSHFPERTKALCQESDAILLGSIGGPDHERHLPKWANCEANALLGLRKSFGFFANLRPTQFFPGLSALSPLKDRIINKGCNILIIRELLGDLYFGKHQTLEKNGQVVAVDECVYSEGQIRSIVKLAFSHAMLRHKKLTSIDKANVLDSSKLWRSIVEDEAKNYPEVSYSHMFVDNAAMQLVLQPGQFDVILCPNMFGDILSDLAAVLPGSLGLMPSASLNKDRFGLYEPAGGSAPDIAGKGIANPIGQILSAAMLLRHSFGLETEAILIEKSIKTCLEQNILTGDLTPDKKGVSTAEFTDEVILRLKSLLSNRA